MNWFTNMLSVLPIVLAGISIWWAHQLKYQFSDGRTSDHKKLRMRILWLSLAILVVNQSVVVWTNYRKGEQAKQEKEEHKQQIYSVQTNLEASFQQRSAKFDSTLFDLKQTVYDLSEKFATNPLVNRELRQQIVLANDQFNEASIQLADLHAWSAGLRGKVRGKLTSEQIVQQAQDDANFNAVVSSYAKAHPVFAYAVSSFTNMFVKESLVKSAVIASTNQSLPIQLKPGDSQWLIGDYNFATNGGWHFTITFYLSAPNVGLSIRSDVGSNLGISSDGHGDLVIPGMQVHSFGYSTNDYKKQVDEAIGYLIGYQDERASNAKK